MMKEKIDLFAITAHELKTPITTLKLLTQIYIQRYKQGVTQIKLEELHAMDRELDRLTGLINDLLDASTMENGKFNLRMQIVDLPALITDIVSQMRIITKSHKIIFKEGANIKKSGEGPGLRVVADPSRLTQVLMNLLSNATKYSPQNSTIKVITRKYKNKVVVSVQDEGEGIAKEKQSSIFDRYYQTDESSKNGMGLGLYITKEIIEKLKGKIWLKSKVHKGSTFSFSLPYTNL